MFTFDKGTLIEEGEFDFLPGKLVGWVKVFPVGQLLLELEQEGFSHGKVSFKNPNYSPPTEEEGAEITAFLSPKQDGSLLGIRIVDGCLCMVWETEANGQVMLGSGGVTIDEDVKLAKQGASLIGEPSMGPKRGQPKWQGAEFLNEPTGKGYTLVRDQPGGWKQGLPATDVKIDIKIPETGESSKGQAQRDGAFEEYSPTHGSPDSRTVKYDAPDQQQSAQSEGRHTKKAGLEAYIEEGGRILHITAGTVGLYREPNQKLHVVGNDAPREFSCAMVYLGGEYKNTLKGIATSIPDEDIYDPKDDRKYGREDKPHATVLFGIHSDKPDETRELLEGVGQISAKIGEFGLFSTDDKYDVLKLSLESEDLHEMHKLLQGSLEHTDSFPVYKPHLTIAYLNKGKGKDYVGDSDWAKKYGEKVAGKTVKFDTVQFSSKDSKKTAIDLEKETKEATGGIMKDALYTFIRKDAELFRKTLINAYTRLHQANPHDPDAVHARMLEAFPKDKEAVTKFLANTGQNIESVHEVSKAVAHKKQANLVCQECEKELSKGEMKKHVMDEHDYSEERADKVIPQFKTAAADPTTTDLREIAALAKKLGNKSLEKKANDLLAQS